MNDTGRWERKRKWGFIIFFKCEILNIQVPSEKVWAGKQLYLDQCSSEPAALMAWPLPWRFRRGEKHSLFFWEHMDTFGLCQRQLVVLRPALIASPQCLPNASRVTGHKTNGNFEYSVRSTESLHFCPHILPLFPPWAQLLCSFL